MIPCRLFLQKVEAAEPEPGPESRPKLSIILNGIYYDQIRPFQTKYLCLTANDILEIEASLNKSQSLVGRVQIQNPHRLALQSKAVQVKIARTQQIKSDINLSFLLEPVAYFSRKERQVDMLEQSRQGLGHYQQNQKPNLLEISFSQRSPRDPLQESNELNFMRDLGTRELCMRELGTRELGTRELRGMYKDSPLFGDTLKSLPEQAESLQSLAHQRQKILGELFGKFKRDK